MQNILCYAADPSNQEGEWIAVDWPAQQNPITGSTKEAAQNNFLAAWSLTQEDVRFFGPILTTAELTTDLGVWTATANADRVYTTSANSEEDCKSQFISMWNSEYVATFGGTEVTDENVDWVTS